MLIISNILGSERDQKYLGYNYVKASFYLNYSNSRANYHFVCSTKISTGIDESKC